MFLKWIYKKFVCLVPMVSRHHIFFKILDAPRDATNQPKPTEIKFIIIIFSWFPDARPLL